MYKLYALSGMGQQIYTWTGDDLGDAIQAGKDMLEDGRCEYAYVIETVVKPQTDAVFFHVYHKWFGKKEEKDES